MLPKLATVLDAEAMQEKLQRLRPLANGGGPEVTSARLVSYKEGNRGRGLIAYELERSAGERFRVFGKHFGDPARAKRVHKIHRFLWSKVFRGTARLGVPEPLGWLPEVSLVLYLPAEGRYLDLALLDGRAADSLDGAAEWLALLHGSRLPLDRRLDLSNELVNVRAWADVVGAAYPEEADVAARISQDLEMRAPEISLEVGTPIHKDFHYRHVIVGGRITVLDFDEMRVGDPSFDLAHFCTYLHLLGCRMGWPQYRLQTLERSFLESYGRRTGWTQDERLAYFSTYTCVKIAKQLCATVGVGPMPTGPEQRRQVRAILERGRTLGASFA